MLREVPAAWAAASHRRAGLVVAVATILAAVAAYYSATHFAIQTDPDEMLDRDLPFRQLGAELRQAFPQYQNSIVVVVDGPNADLVERGTDELVAAIEKRPRAFASIFDPQGMPFFRKNGLLYLEPDELADLVDRLADAQPLLGTLWSEPNLPGLFDVLRRAVEEARKGEAPLEIDFVYDSVAKVVEALAAGEPHHLSWQELMRGRELEPGERRRLVVVQPVLDYGAIQPAGAALDGIREIDRELALGERYGVRIRVTGSTALETEELRTVRDGLGFATALTAVLVGVLLVRGLRSGRLVVSALVTLFVGLTISVALAFLLVGRLNLISVAFAVLFVGLSVDFGIHLSLRVREERDRGVDLGTAIREGAAGVGGSLALCTLAAAIGFFSFLPTDYVGLAELGMIAGTSMFVAFVANLTLLPAMITLLPPAPGGATGEGRPSGGGAFVRRHAKGIVVSAALVAVACAILATQARFDFDPLNLRDPETESVQTLFELAGEWRTTPYRTVALANDLDAARDLGRRVRELPEVRSTTTAWDFVPKDQEDKLETIFTAALFLLPALEGAPGGPASPEERRRSVAAFRRDLDALVADAPGGHGTPAEDRLAEALSALEQGRGLDGETLAELETRLVATLPARLEDLKLSLSAEPVGLEDLPGEVRNRWISGDGRARLEITPRRQLLDDHRALREFVAAVRTEIPEVSGMPVDILESGRAVVRSFRTATALSVVLVAGLVAVVLRRKRDVAFVFAPLGLAALLTVASSVLLGLPFNFANVIVLPLLFGLGVASGIHLVLRAREEGQAGSGAVLATSTPRAVVFSSLTTIGSFGSLAVSGHPGTVSMGILLTVAISWTLVATLVVLPALMEVATWVEPSRSSSKRPET